MRYDGAVIDVLNWDTYNPRKDLKATSWLRLQNSLFEDPNFFDFSHGELLVWVYLLCLCSKKQSGQVRLVFAHAERVGRLRSSDLENALLKLQELQCIRVTLRVRDVDVTPTLRTRHTTNERTNVTNEQYCAAEAARVSLDFDKIYQQYPRKLGKKKGIERLKALIKTPEQLARFERAVRNYANLVQGNDPKYTKHFSSFVSCWEDYAELPTQELPKEHQEKILAEQLAKEKAEAQALTLQRQNELWAQFEEPNQEETYE